MDRLNVGLFNDSFPPTIDGVAQAVKNYADVLHRNHCDVTVVTPEYKGVKDEYPFDVFRYHSITASATGRAIRSIRKPSSNCAANILI